MCKRQRIKDRGAYWRRAAAARLVLVVGKVEKSKKMSEREGKTEEGAMKVKRESILSQISCADGREEAVAAWYSDEREGRDRKE
jgi:hypothetical protein